MIYLEQTPEIGYIPGCISINFKTSPVHIDHGWDPQLPVQLPFFPGPPWHPSPQTCHQTSGTAAQRKPAARHDVESGTLQWTQRRILTKCRAPWNSSCGSPRSWSPLFVRQFHEQQPKTPGPRHKHCSWHRVLLEYLYIESIVSKARGRHEWENWRI